MKNIMIKTSVLLVCLALTPSSFARGKHKDKGNRDGIFKQLDLSKDQKAELKEIRKSQKEKMKSLKEAQKASREKFHDALKSGASDSSLKSLHAKMVSSGVDFKTARFDNMLKTRKILNADQKKKFHELKSQWKGHKKGERD